MKEFFTQKEINEMVFFQETFFEGLEQDFVSHIKTKYNTADKLDQYSQIPIRQRFFIAKSLQSNIINGSFPTEEDVESAIAIICNILLSIEKDYLDKVEIITDIIEPSKN